MAKDKKQLFDAPAESTGPVECLGMTFESDEARRAYFTEKLREKLQDPEFRKIEGFPVGDDDDILALSDPPYYTACPNPFFPDFLNDVEKHRNSQPDPYHREPFTADVQEGKNDPIYNAHSYHTKVPHKAIMRYLLYYTNPGDLVLDGFCGTGMTGVAASECGSPDPQFKSDVERDFRDAGLPKPKWGIRNAVLTELSPAATFIASRFNTPVDSKHFQKVATQILDDVEDECAWMFETNHNKHQKGRINFTLWSDVFSCPECIGEIVFWRAAVDKERGGVKDSFPCPHCKARLTKKSLQRTKETHFDGALQDTITQCKQVPVLINYSVSGESGRFEKEPDSHDLAALNRLTLSEIPYWYPTQRTMEGRETRRNDPCGITHAHHFYNLRNLHVLAALHQRIRERLSECPLLGMWFTSTHVWATRLNRLLTSNYFKKRGGVIGQTLQGTLYISSLSIETNALERFRLRINSVPFSASSRSAFVGTGSTEQLSLPDDSIDYIFTDPPFGANIAYSELNFLWEAWLAVFTNIGREAIENPGHSKSLFDYQRIMESCFREYYRVLKPGRWITVEFSNTRAAVWNVIQTTLERAGFIVANVAALEKTHKGYRAVTTPTAVKQDLVISAYKPNGGLEQRFTLEAGTEEGVWDFVRTHLGQLPVFVSRDGKAETLAERRNYMLYDRMVAFHVQRGVTVPMSSGEFFVGLSERFSERDGMYFLSDQAVAYDKKRANVTESVQLQLFVTNEVSAIQWLRERLGARPQSRQDIQPAFMKEISGWQKHEAELELDELLQQNFLCFDGKDELPSQVHSYLSSNFHELRNLEKDDPKLIAKAKNRWYVPDPRKEADLEKIRHRALMKEFNEYVEGKGKLKVVRTEALRAGFKECWQNGDYKTIVGMAKRVKDDIIQEDPALLMYYDNALMRAEG